jgi:hypothetical protein
VIVVTDGSDSALDSRVKELLGPGDRMICHATTNLHLLYNLGAREAKGTLLFITEPHCIVEPECLEELVNFFATHDYDGASCRSVSIHPPNGWARMEERLHETHLRMFSRQDDWRKVLLRGFAIYRDIYLEEGGFEDSFGRFAEWALAAKLHSQGRRLGYAAAAAVRHPFTTTSRQLFASVRDFTRGECAYRAISPAEYCERYFGHAPEWAQREALRPSIARSAFRASWRSPWQSALGRGGCSMVRAQVKALCQLLPVALLGPRWRLLGAAWSLRTAIARSVVWRFNDRKLYRAYCDSHDRMVRYSRIEFIAEYLAYSIPAPPEALHYQLSEMEEKWLVAFHPVERWGEDAFRWSGPVSLVRLRVPVGAYDVQIQTRSVRQAPGSLCLGVFFNRHRVAAPSLQWNDGLLSFRIDSSMFDPSPEQRLIFTCNPVRPWKVGVPDRRELGLPIFSITFRPIEEAVSEATNHHRQLFVR